MVEQVILTREEYEELLKTKEALRKEILSEVLPEFSKEEDDISDLEIKEIIRMLLEKYRVERDLQRYMTGQYYSLVEKVKVYNVSGLIHRIFNNIIV